MEFKPWPVVWTGNFEAVPFLILRVFLIVCATEMQRRAMEAGAGLGLGGSKQGAHRSLRRCQYSDLAPLAGGPWVG